MRIHLKWRRVNFLKSPKLFVCKLWCLKYPLVETDLNWMFLYFLWFLLIQKLILKLLLIFYWNHCWFFIEIIVEFLLKLLLIFILKYCWFSFPFFYPIYHFRFIVEAFNKSGDIYIIEKSKLLILSQSFLKEETEKLENNEVCITFIYFQTRSQYKNIK